MIIYTTLLALLFTCCTAISCGDAYLDECPSPFRSLPAAGTAAVRNSYLEINYNKLQKELTATPSPQGQEKLIHTFHDEIILPTKKHLKENNCDSTLCTNIETELAGRLCIIKFAKGSEEPVHSANAFNEHFRLFQHLSESEKKQYQKQMHRLWEASLQHGTLKQINTLCACTPFSPKQCDALYKRISSQPIDRQISCIATLLKKSPNFGSIIKQAEKKQGSSAWHLSLRTALTQHQGQEFFDLFKVDATTFAEQLFMKTLQPYMEAKNLSTQKMVLVILDLWAHNACSDNKEDSHECYTKIWELIHNDAAMKKQLESATKYNTHLALWCAQIPPMVWIKHKEKHGQNKLFQTEQLNLIKKAESLLASITSIRASELDKRDNASRVSMHESVLRGLLRKSQPAEKRVIEMYCTHALQSGIDITDPEYIPDIAKYLSSATFLKLVEPYCIKNCTLNYNLGLLYENGYRQESYALTTNSLKQAITQTVHWWLEPNIEKAQAIFEALLEQGHMQAGSKLISYIKKNSPKAVDSDSFETTEKIAQFCQKWYKRFPTSSVFAMWYAMALCNVVSASPDPIDQQMIVSEATIERIIATINETCSSLPHKEFVHFSALQASFQSIKYRFDKTCGTLKNEELAITTIAKHVHDTYKLSLHAEASLLPVASALFDDSVDTNLRTYAEKILKKERKSASPTDLQMLALSGYVTLRTAINATPRRIHKNDARSIDDMIQFSLTESGHAKLPPLIHALAFLRLLQGNPKQCDDTLYEHLKQALQPGIDTKKYDAVAYYESEIILHTLALGGDIKAQMLLVREQDKTRDLVVQFLAQSKQPDPIPQEFVPFSISWLNSCGGYAKLKEKIIKGSCAFCRTDNATLLMRWIHTLTHNSNQSDPLLKPFFDDIQLIKPYLNG